MDTRKWWQKFVDQTMFGYRYTLTLSTEQSTKILKELHNLKQSLRIKDLISTFVTASSYPTTVNGTQIILVKLDTSDTIMVRDILGLSKTQLKELTQSYTEETGLSTITHYPSK
jgi:hypothetical protein